MSKQTTMNPAFKLREPMVIEYQSDLPTRVSTRPFDAPNTSTEGTPACRTRVGPTQLSQRCLTPGLPLAHFIRGIVRLQSASFEESVSDLTVAINGGYSTTPMAYQLRGLALQQLGRGEEAEKDLATFQRLQQATQGAPTP